MENIREHLIDQHGWNAEMARLVHPANSSRKAMDEYHQRMHDDPTSVHLEHDHVDPSGR